MSAARAVRIITDVAAVDRPFDYLVTEKTAQVAIGDRVRVDFNNRSVRGWVIDEVEVDRELKPLTKWLGYGPPPSLLALLNWASVRWYSPVSRFLISTSPKRLITSLPVAPAKNPLSAAASQSALRIAPGVIQVSPTTDPLALILGAYEDSLSREGSLLVLVPTESWASRLRGRLEQRGCAVASGENEWDRMRSGWPVVVGARGTALAPVPKVSGAVIIDADDESYRSEAAPTWDTLTMLRERCARDNAPLWATSCLPSPALVNSLPFEKTDDITTGWPSVEIIDRRNSDPRDGVLSREAVDAAHKALSTNEPVAVVVVLQRLGTGKLFVCQKCGELARCPKCSQGEEEVGEFLSCADRHEMRGNFCLHCGATNLKRVRTGVTTLARDVGAQLSQDVTEITGASDLEGALHRVVVGTEAVWQRVRHCGVVIFVDFDQYLLAPRDSARRSALRAVAKAGRLVGSRKDAKGEVVLQTRRSQDIVLRSLQSLDFAELMKEDDLDSQVLKLPPYGAVASVSGESAEAFVKEFSDPRVTIHQSGDTFELRSESFEVLCNALKEVERPSGKFRVAVK